jgi:hypothetical protein
MASIMTITRSQGVEYLASALAVIGAFVLSQSLEHALIAYSIMLTSSVLLLVFGMSKRLFGIAAMALCFTVTNINGLANNARNGLNARVKQENPMQTQSHQRCYTIWRFRNVAGDDVREVVRCAEPDDLSVQHEYQQVLWRGNAFSASDPLNRHELKQRLFSGAYPCGIVYADRAREVAGDYKRLAFLSYASLELEIEHDCPDDLAALIRDDAALIQAQRGQHFQISTAGQTVLLGGRT